MRRLIASINVTLDGFCDHTAVIADDELHEEVNILMREVGLLLFGRVTYQLMEESWPPMVQEPTGNKPEDDFARLIDDTPKLVFSNTLKEVSWNNTTLAKSGLKETVIKLKSDPGKPILVGSPSLIAQLTQLQLLDELRLFINPIILGNGLRLFPASQQRLDLELITSKRLGSGVVVNTYRSLAKTGS